MLKRYGSNETFALIKINFSVKEI